MTTLHRPSADDVLDLVRKALDRDDVGGAIAALDLLKEQVDVHDVFDELDVDDQAAMLPRMEPEDSAEIMASLDTDDQAELAERVDDTTLARVLDEMEPDDAADVIGDLPDKRKEQVLAAMEDADDIRPLLIHPDESAGGLMTNSFLTLRPNMTAQDAIEALRQWHPEDALPYYLFVVDRDRKLVGVVALRALITSSPSAPIHTVMSPNVVSVPAGTDQEECARLLKRHGFLALPVVDGEGRLIGVITVDDLVDVIEEEATEDVFRLSGNPDEEKVFSSIGLSMRRRMPWLYINLGTAFLAAWVVSLFESTIAQVAILAAMQSMVAGQGGNAATQRIAILVRGLATGEVDVHDTLRVVLKETFIGLLQGLGIALVVGGGVAVWKGNWILGAVIGIAMMGNLVVAGIAGTSIPFLLKRLRLDPALSSAVIVTTFTDCCGFAFSLGLATLLLRFLV